LEEVLERNDRAGKSALSKDLDLPYHCFTISDPDLMLVSMKEETIAQTCHVRRR